VVKSVEIVSLRRRGTILDNMNYKSSGTIYDLEYTVSIEDKILDTRDITSCRRCGECCRSLVKGVKVTQQEWEAIEEHINKLGLDPATIQESKTSLRLPTKGENDLRRCAFLKDKNVCEVYDRRPKECERFPIWTIEGRSNETFVVSSVCPRAEALAMRLKEDLPDWARELLHGRSYRVVLI